MPTNVVNCRKSDFPPGRYLKIQIPSQNPFSPGTLKSDYPPWVNPLENPDSSPKFWGEMTLWQCFCFTGNPIPILHQSVMSAVTLEVSKYASPSGTTLHMACLVSSNMPLVALEGFRRPLNGDIRGADTRKGACWFNNPNQARISAREVC